MRVAFFFLADAAQASPDGKISVLGAGIEGIGSPSFPLVHPYLAVVLKLWSEEPEPQKEWVLTVALSAKDGTPEKFRYQQVVQPTSINPAFRPSATLILNVTPLQLDLPGDYFFDLSVDGNVVDTIKLTAKLTKR